MGNITLKLCEGVVQSLFERIKDAVNAHWMARITGPVLRRALNPLIRTLDWERVGAAPLLGLNGLALVAHGRSTAESIANAVAQARKCAHSHLRICWLGTDGGESNGNDQHHGTAHPISAGG